MKANRRVSFAQNRKSSKAGGGKKTLIFLAVAFVVAAVSLSTLYLFSGTVARRMGHFLVKDQEPAPSDAVVVLFTEGVDYTPRLAQAADLYRRGFAQRVVINGNRKSDEMRSLEGDGFQPCCAWYEDTVRMLQVMGVPRSRVTAISAENVYDTVSEAKAVGQVLKKAGVSSVILTTSKSHTRRAHFIWSTLFPDGFTICTVAAEKDPYSPSSWWKRPRWIRSTMWEYGAWIFYHWKTRLPLFQD